MATIAATYGGLPMQHGAPVADRPDAAGDRAQGANERNRDESRVLTIVKDQPDRLPRREKGSRHGKSVPFDQLADGWGVRMGAPTPVGRDGRWRFPAAVRQVLVAFGCSPGEQRRTFLEAVVGLPGPRHAASRHKVSWRRAATRSSKQCASSSRR